MSRRIGMFGLAMFTLAVMAGVLAARAPEDKADAPRRRVETRVARDQDEPTLDRAADSVRKDRARFREQTRKDGDLRIVMTNGRPAYACRPPRFAEKAAARAAHAQPSDVGTDTSPYVNDAPFPLEQTFALHTRPGATRILYLDFDGFTVHATDWNNTNHAYDDIVVAPFDIDGDPATFSERERADIQEIWRRVAEDFAPFDVDVTTEDPGQANLLYDGPGDDHWGMRMVCGGQAVDILGPGNEGVIGVAYLDSFQGGFSYDSDGNPGTDTPAFTFADDIIEGEPVHYAAEIASTASHEFGHTLGLQHDGDGMREYYPGYLGWAPIMGSGDPLGVVQWSKGEYPRANNKEDDLALIAANYLPYMEPDHGAAPAAAVPLASGETAGGVILRADDTAWYRVQTGAGQFSVTGSVATPDFGNLRMKLSLVDLHGTTLATAVPPAGKMAATLSAAVTAGTYYLVVDGAPYLTPSTGYSDYDSIGRFSIVGSWPDRPANQAPVADLSDSLPLSGIAPLDVAFSGLASRDLDGAVVGYSWDFGDASPSSALASPTHAYAAPGDYEVTLTVTDNDGATATTHGTIWVVALPPGARTFSVARMTGGWQRSGSGMASGACTVVVRDNTGRPVADVVVTARLSGLVSGTVSARTDRSGRATLRTSPIAAPPSRSKSKSDSSGGEVVFTVTNLGSTGGYYYPVANKVGTFTLRR